MTIAYWCVLAAAVLPYVSVAFAKYRPDYDNARPREWLARLDGFRARAVWAHHNAFEAFPPFAAGVIIAHLAGAPQGRIDALALAFIAARIAYTACYLLDRPTPRSIVWTVGFACVIGLFVAAAL
ncbi:MAG TPA: MAPEG family protein [Pelomicrobium sp.]|nr:MAPEG family protein [Pelomicrobium sp.]